MNDYSYSYDYSTTSTDPAASAAAFVLIAGLEFLLVAAIYVVTAIFLGLIFKKAGVPRWAAWVPFYNTWKLLEIGGQPGFWSILSIIPIVNIVSAIFVYISMYHIGLKLGKPGAFVLLGIFLPIVWMIWLGVDKSKWGDSYDTPAVTPPAAPAA